MDEQGTRNVDCPLELIGSCLEQTRSALRQRLKSFAALHPAV